LNGRKQKQDVFFVPQNSVIRQMKPANNQSYNNLSKWFLPHYYPSRRIF
jgi:hypothetical protein